MMRVNKYSFIPMLMVLLLLPLLSGCDQPKAAPPPQQLPKVTVSQPVVKNVVEWDEYTGRLDAVESVEVRARVSGYLESVHFKDGQIVKEGDLLFVIDPRPYQAELERTKAETELAKARLSLAKEDFARAALLAEANAISREDYDTRASQLQQARAALKAAEAAVRTAKLDLEFTRVTAPVDGRTGRRQVTEGNLINGGTAQSTLLTTIVSLNPIYVYFETDEKAHLKYVRLDRKGIRKSSREHRNPVYMALADEKGFPHKGYIDFVDNRLDTTTGTMTGRAVFENPDLIMSPGLFARLRLVGSEEYQALMLPDEAIGSDLSQKFVLVVNEDNLVEYRTVEIGPVIDGLRVIRQGITAQDWVIVNGIQRARSNEKVIPLKKEINVASEASITQM